MEVFDKTGIQSETFGGPRFSPYLYTMTQTDNNIKYPEVIPTDVKQGSRCSIGGEELTFIGTGHYSIVGLLKLHSEENINKVIEIFNRVGYSKMIDELIELKDMGEVLNSIETWDVIEPGVIEDVNGETAQLILSK